MMTGLGCLRVSLSDLSKRSAWASPSGNLLEFPQPRSRSWCFGQFQLSFSAKPSGHLASPAMFAKREGELRCTGFEVCLGEGFQIGKTYLKVFADHFVAIDEQAHHFPDVGLMSMDRPRDIG
jgi:hypothetical protein